MSIELPDLGNVGAQIEVRGVAVTPRGLGLGDLITLMVETPALLKAGYKDIGTFMQVLLSSQALLNRVFEICCDLSQAAAAKIDASEQAMLLAPIMEQTFRAGIGPFAKLVETAVAILDPELPGNQILQNDELRDKIRAKARSMNSSPKPSDSSTQDSVGIS